MRRGKKKAFTLTELLVVVIVIGVLSAVVLPKFSKVIETRKTTEAEEMMAMVRTEQERRCSLDKNYTTDAATVNLASLKTKNFNYTLNNTGIEAASTGKYGYTLKMPSYRDGRLCCDNAEQCAKLNKNYPLCSELTAKADYTIGEECSAAEEPNPPKPCEGPSEEACGCKNGGTRTRTCDTTTGTWSTWSDCSIMDTCPCPPPEPNNTEKCNECGKRTRTVTCDVTTGEWKTGPFGTCSVSSPSKCNPPGPGPNPPGPNPNPPDSCPEDLRAYCTKLGQEAYECGACAPCNGDGETGGSETGGSGSGGSDSGASDSGGLGAGDGIWCADCVDLSMPNRNVICSIEVFGYHVNDSCQIIEGNEGYSCNSKTQACSN